MRFNFLIISYHYWSVFVFISPSSHTSNASCFCTGINMAESESTSGGRRNDTFTMGTLTNVHFAFVYLVDQIATVSQILTHNQTKRFRLHCLPFVPSITPCTNFFSIQRIPLISQHYLVIVCSHRSSFASIITSYGSR